MIQLTQSGTVCTMSNEEISKLRHHFDVRHYVTVPGLLAGEILDRLKDRLGDHQFKLRHHGTLSTELSLQDTRLTALLNFLANREAFLRLVETITGCDRIGSFEGRVYRMMSGHEHRDDWHNDMSDTRMVAMSINLSATPYLGGALEIRQRDSGNVVARVADLELGDAVLFRLADNLQHRRTEVRGNSSKTAFAGWFRQQPDFISELKRLRLES
jgi:2OG-Fe(II) oxygenase superfamily